MNRFLLSTLLLFTASQMQAQQVIPLYNGAIPGAKMPTGDYKEGTAGVANDMRYFKVTTPALQVFSPEKPNGTGVIICPGGGYALLAYDKEGALVAQRLAKLGVTAFVLKYRLPSDELMQDKSFGPLQDAMQAMYLVRKNAGKWQLDTAKIGVMGFSAGGHLASSLSTHYADGKLGIAERISLRPSFSILIYPVITMGQYTHAGSKANLLGTSPKTDQVQYFSNELQVNAQTPPTFLVHANDDASVPVVNTLMYNEALAKNKVPASVHIYPHGGHGFGLNNKTTSDDWFERLTEWLKDSKLL